MESGSAKGGSGGGAAALSSAHASASGGGSRSAGGSDSASGSAGGSCPSASASGSGPSASAGGSGPSGSAGGSGPSGSTSGSGFSGGAGAEGAASAAQAPLAPPTPTAAAATAAPSTARALASACADLPAAELTAAEAVTAAAAPAAPSAGAAAGGALPCLLECSISQYSLGEGGKSACTAIALCGAALLLPLLDGGRPLLAEHVTAAVLEGMQAASGFAAAHTSCVEVWEANAAALGASLVALNLGSEAMGSLLDATGLEDLCAQARGAAGADALRSTAVVLTKPPETVCLFLPPAQPGAAAAGLQQRFALLDSHPRPGRSHAYLATFATQAALLRAVRDIFPAFVVPEGDEPWDEGVLFMYNAFEGSFLQGR